NLSTSPRAHATPPRFPGTAGALSVGAGLVGSITSGPAPLPGDAGTAWPVPARRLWGAPRPPRRPLQLPAGYGTMRWGVTDVRVFMRIPERKEWHFEGRRSVKSILEELDINPETVIIICGDTLLT